MWLWPFSWIGKLVAVAAALAAVAVVGGGLFYLSDGRIEATVVDKSCDLLRQSTITVRTVWLGLETTKPLDHAQCVAVQVGFFVEYSVRSGRSVVYDSEGGRCIWDSARGPCAT